MPEIHSSLSSDGRDSVSSEVMLRCELHELPFPEPDESSLAGCVRMAADLVWVALLGVALEHDARRIVHSALIRILALPEVAGRAEIVVALAFENIAALG